MCTLYVNFRRQQEVVLPVLFKCAASGNVDAISEVLEEGDDVNILVCPSTGVVW